MIKRMTVKEAAATLNFYAKQRDAAHSSGMEWVPSKGSLKSIECAKEILFSKSKNPDSYLTNLAKEMFYASN